MNSKKCFISASAAALVIWSLAPQAGAQTELGSEWTYQGLLKLSSDPLNDTADFEFTLWDADVDGNMIGALVLVNSVTVVDGLFTAEVDFGVAAFNGDARWLQIAVRSPAGAGEFTTLGQRQPLTAAPYALQTRGIFVNDAGNVGIGTTTPSAKLVVVDTNANIVLRKDDDTFSANLILQGGGTQYNLGTPAADRFRLWNNSSGEVWTVLPNGNVGIGTTTPPTKLGVVGTVTASALDIIGGNVSLNGGWLSGDGENEGVFVVSGGGNVGIGTMAPQTKLGVAGGIRVEGTIFNHGGLTLSGGGLGVSILMDTDDESSDVFNIFDGGVERFRVEGNTGNVGIGTANPGAKLHVRGGNILADRGAVTSSLSRSLLLGGARGLSGTAYATIQFQNFDENGNLNDDYIGGEIRSHNDGDVDAGDLRFFVNDGNGEGTSEGMRIDRNGNVGIGTETPGFPLTFPNTLGDKISLWGQSGENYGFGIQAGTLQIHTPNATADIVFGHGESASLTETMRIKGNGNVGIGTATPTDAILDVEGDMHINDHDIFLRGGSDRNHGLGWYGSGKAFAGAEPDGPILFGHRGGALGTKQGGERIALRWDSDLNVVASGQFAANCVVINGGCDLAEPFEVTGASVEPGMLVSIDPENPGQLRLTRNAYDTMVAGVASGAGGVNVGMTLSQEGLFDRGQPVALVGRVYCWCDASNGPIRPGDLLTSSDTPGHAMSVTDRERAFGTTIGKAMSPLKSGKGLVLVLVNLQ